MINYHFKAMDCLDNDLENDTENNVWNLKHNVERLQEFLNRTYNAKN